MIKGIITPMAVTMIVLVVFVMVSIAVIFLSLYARFSFSGVSPVAYTIDFVDITNKPYSVAEVLTNYRIGDRQFLEHSLESTVMGKLTTSEVKGGLVELLDTYNFRFYSVEIKKGEEIIYSSDINRPGRSRIQRCGNGFEGLCVLEFMSSLKPAGPCGVGFIEIDPGDNDCPIDLAISSDSACCLFSPERYPDEGVGNFEIVRCGASFNGICNPLACQPTTVRINDDDLCRDANSGGTTICCQFLEESLEESVISATATIPIFYKGESGTIEVTVG